jgi:DNA invertase Pin-like site-specific DNA recombinase
MHTDTPPGIPTRAIIYCRMSKDREGAGLGVARQRQDCEQLAVQLGVEVVAVYSDNDLSAYSGKPRPDYKQLLDDLRSGRADTVLTWHTDRLHRSPAELEEYIDVCEPRRVQTRTVKAGNLDLTTATGRMIARQLGVQARYEVERMVERQRRKRDEMAQNGKYFGGRRPFGYEPGGILLRSLYCATCGRTDPDDFTTTVLCTECGSTGGFDGWACEKCQAPHGRAVKCVCKRCDQLAAVAPESEAASVREVADTVLAGGSLRSIAADWNERGILTSTGSDWEGPEVRSMLLRPRNAGIVKHRGKESGPASWPAILDEPLWRSIVALLEDPGRRITPGNERKYLGSNIYRCGLCADGTTMRCSTSNKAKGGAYHPAYACRKSKHVARRAEPLDDYIRLLILDRVSRPDAADLLAEREDPVDVRGAQTEMKEARETLDELAEALGAGEMDMQEWRAASRPAKARLKAAEDTLSRAVQANPVVGLVGADDVEAAWNRLGLSRQRAVLAYLMTVTVRPARRGRLPGGVYFDADSVDIVWW